MNNIDYLAKAENVLYSIESTCDRINDQLNIDIDNRRLGSMVTLSFTNGSEIVVNLQKPLQEIWLATLSGGFHYRFNKGVWLETKSGSEFFNQLSSCASKQAGQIIEFNEA